MLIEESTGGAGPGRRVRIACPQSAPARGPGPGSAMPAGPWAVDRDAKLLNSAGKFCKKFFFQSFSFVREVKLKFTSLSGGRQARGFPRPRVPPADPSARPANKASPLA